MPECTCHGEPMGRNGKGWRCLVKHRERERRYRMDDAYRERQLARQRAHYHNDFAARDHMLSVKRDRYRLDTSFRERHLQKKRERYWKLSGLEYNRWLLQQRRNAALRRMKERHQRSEDERG